MKMNKLCCTAGWKSALSCAVLGGLLVAPCTAWRAFGQTSFEPGTFQGILESGSDNDESFGFITLTLTRSGTFSMRFNLGVKNVGHHNYAISGRFNDSGAFHYEGPAITDTRFAYARFIDLQLDNVSTPMSIQGTVTDGTHSSSIVIERLAAFGLANPAPEAGRYTFVIPNPGNSGLPAGTGFGVVSINQWGHIVASSRMADGRIWAQGANLTVSGRWPIFARVGAGFHGIVAGWMTFQDRSDSDFSGTLTWLGPEVPGPNNAFVPAFSGDFQMIGSHYVGSFRSPVLQGNSSSNNVTLTLSSGGLDNTIERQLTLTSNNRFIFSPRLAGDSMGVAIGSGIFSGTFLHPDNHIVVFRGVILQKQNLGAGSFLDMNGESGTVTLRAQ